MLTKSGRTPTAFLDPLSWGPWVGRARARAHVCRPTDDLTIALPTDVIREVPAKLVHKQQVSEDVVILRFEIAREHSFPFESGQFVHLVRSDGLTRPYSIASVPADGYVELHVRRVRDGAMSRWLYDQIPVGEPVRLRGPNGDCCYVPEHPDAPPDTHVLARVEGLPNDLVATHPTLDATTKRALANALAELPPDVTTRLAELGIVAFEPARAEELTALDAWTEAW